MFSLITLLAIGYSVGDEIVRKELTSHPNWGLLDRGDNCGKSESYRIIGGENAVLGEYPWLALLFYSESVQGGTKLDFQCSGSIISERYVLTAAHCSTKIVQDKLVNVRLGENDLSRDTDCEDGFCAKPVQDIGVEKEICHEHYERKSQTNDICLIRLMEPIQFNDFVSPICLPIFEYMQKQPVEGEITYVAGWGYTDSQKEQDSSVLKSLRVPVMSHRRCAALYKSAVQITQRHICAGGEVGKDSCKGDSGGPLMKVCSVNTVPRYFIIGIISFGQHMCATPHYPSVFTAVSEYMTWILDNVYQ